MTDPLPDSSPVTAADLAVLQGQEPAPRPEPETDTEPFAADPTEVVHEDDLDPDAADPAPRSRDTRYDDDPVSGSYVEDEDDEDGEDAWGLTGRQ